MKNKRVAAAGIIGLAAILLLGYILVKKSADPKPYVYCTDGVWNVHLLSESDYEACPSQWTSQVTETADGFTVVLTNNTAAALSYAPELFEAQLDVFLSDKFSNECWRRVPKLPTDEITGHVDIGRNCGAGKSLEKSFVLANVLADYPELPSEQYRIITMHSAYYFTVE